MGKIDNHSERFALAHEIASESGQSIARRTARGKNAAAAGGVAPRVRQPDHAHSQFVEGAQQIQILA